MKIIYTFFIRIAIEKYEKKVLSCTLSPLLEDSQPLLHFLFG